MPDNLPFDIDDIDIEDDGVEMNVGGMVDPRIQMQQKQNDPSKPRSGYVKYKGYTSFVGDITNIPQEAMSEVEVLEI